MATPFDGMPPPFAADRPTPRQEAPGIDWAGVLSAPDEAGLSKHYFGGSHRSREPAETLRALLPKLAEFGITRIADVTGLDWIGVPVIMAIRPNARSLAVSQGKGLTLDAAKVSGVMESIELHHAEHIDRPLRLASLNEMSARARVVDLRRVPASRHHRLDPDRRMLWIEGFDLIALAETWVPLELVTTDSVDDALPGAGVFGSSSNGLASGNHPVEAAVHALSELIERDAVNLWGRRGDEARASTRIDLASIVSPAAQTVLQRFEAARMHTMVWDTTSDIGAPTYLCMIAEDTPRPERARYASVGSGCHPSRETALIRAMTEAAQSRLTLISGARDDIFREEYDWDHYTPKDVDRHLGLHPASGGWRRFADTPEHQGVTIEADLRWLLDGLKRVGCEQAVAVDLAQPQWAIPVVRMIVPGLEGHARMRDHAPGERARRVMEAQD